MTLYAEENSRQAPSGLSIVDSFEFLDALFCPLVYLILRLTLDQSLGHFIEFELSLVVHLLQLLLTHAI